MDENTIEMNRQDTPTVPQTPQALSFFSKYKKVLFWIAIILLMFVTWYFSESIQTRGTDGAATFLSGHGVNTIISLYTDRAEPKMVSVRRGDSVEFMVKDASRHDITERRSDGRRGDARIASGEFGSDESYSLQFNTSGVFSFYDRMNQDISIEVEVR